MDTRQIEAVLTSTCNHNQFIRAKIRKIMYTPVHPSFTIETWGVGGINNMGMFARLTKKQLFS